MSRQHANSMLCCREVLGDVTGARALAADRHPLRTSLAAPCPPLPAPILRTLRVRNRRPLVEGTGRGHRRRARRRYITHLEASPRPVAHSEGTPHTRKRASPALLDVAARMQARLHGPTPHRLQGGARGLLRPGAGWETRGAERPAPGACRGTGASRRRGWDAPGRTTGTRRCGRRGARESRQLARASVLTVLTCPAKGPAVCSMQ